METAGQAAAMFEERDLGPGVGEEAGGEPSGGLPLEVGVGKGGKAGLASKERAGLQVKLTAEQTVWL